MAQNLVAGPSWALTPPTVSFRAGGDSWQRGSHLWVRLVILISYDLALSLLQTCVGCIGRCVGCVAVIGEMFCHRSCTNCKDCEFHHSDKLYRVILVVSELGWVDLDLRCSQGWWAATVATYCPSRMVEHLKSKSTKPDSQITIVTL